MRRPRENSALLVSATLACLFVRGAAADDPQKRVVRTAEELRRACAAAVPGTRISIAPGTYDGGLHFVGLAGKEGKPIVLAAADPANPPLFRGDGSGMQLSDPAYVELVDLAFEGQTGNGVNVDDGGSIDSPAHHVSLRRLVVRDVGPDGNCDGIKLSGLDDFTVDSCTVERWGRGGSAVDLVGCRRGTIEGSTFRHGLAATGASGVQMKGGTSEVVVRKNRFENAGSRGVNAGGSTGLAYFRPALDAWKGPKWEAKALTIEGNTFSGSQAPVAFVGVDGAVFRFNTIHRPDRWAFRMLQETRAEGFVPCRNVEVSDNLIVFSTDRWAEGGVNVGSGTEPSSFRFARNFWWASDAPDRTRASVRLPTPEVDGVYGKDPRFVDAAALDLRVAASSPAARVGAHALPK